MYVFDRSVNFESTLWFQNFFQKKQTKLTILEDYYLKVNTKREFMFFLQEDRLFCTNLEVVNFQDSELGSFFGRTYDVIICFRNLLTFRTSW